MVIGFVLIIYAILSGGDLMAFVDVKSIVIVIGGTIAGTVVAYPLDKLKNLTKVMRTLSRKSEGDADLIIETLVGYAEKARREGLLALEDDVAQMAEPFLQKGVQLIVDGTDPELVRSILETELNFVEDRHKSNAAIFDNMGNLAPAFGMIGTLIGLILMLRNLSDASSIGSGMAVALVTTFYGSVLSNLVFLPLGTKLRTQSRGEILLKEVMIEGILSIQAGENPRIVEEKLKAFLAPKSKEAAPASAQEAVTVERDG
jgi:chemotaxis protein MotA